MFPVTPFINHVLGQHGWAQDKLKAHAGRVVRADFAPVSLALRITSTGAVEDAALTTPAQVTLTLNALRLPLMLADPEAALRDVRIEGDAELAQLIGQLVRELKWDAEEDLSKIVGDVPAFRLAQAARSLRGWGRDASQRLAENTAAFLVDEEPTLVRKSMAAEFAGDVATLRDDCARLEKRLELLETRRGR